MLCARLLFAIGLAGACSSQPSEPFRLAKAGGDEQQARAGGDLPLPLVVRITDISGRGIQDAEVLWRLGSADDEPVTARTDRHGFARVSWVLNSHSSDQYAYADAPGLQRVMFHASASNARARPGLDAPRLVPIGAPQPSTIPDLWRGTSERTAVEAAATTSVQGRIYLLQGAGSSGARVILRTGALGDTTMTDATGFFAFLIPQTRAGETFRLRVEPDPDRYFPVELTAGESDKSTAIVVVPRTWRIRGGAYAGTEVPLDLPRAALPACPRCDALIRRTRDGVYGWESPLPLRTSTTLPETDEAAFWSIAADLASVYGFPLVARDDKAAQVRVELDIRQSNLGETAASTQGRDILAATITYRQPGLLSGSRGTYLVAHELMHSLGFGHTCSWPSVLADFRECPQMRAEGPTQYDVAFTEMLTSLREVERRLHTQSMMKGIQF